MVTRNRHWFVDRNMVLLPVVLTMSERGQDTRGILEARRSREEDGNR